MRSFPVALSAALLLAAPACTEPSYGAAAGDASPVRCRAGECDAAQTVDTAEVDAGRVVTAAAGVEAGSSLAPDAVDAETLVGARDGGVALPTAAAALLGHYAIRVRWFARDSMNLASFTHETVLLAHVRFDAPAAALRMDASICADRGTIQGALNSSSEVVFPERLPSRTYTVEVSGGVFSTLGGQAALGFDTEPRADCAPGRRVASGPEQVWNTDGLCECPNNASPPTLMSDCRVTDPDRDGKPGFAVALGGSVDAADSVRVLESSQFVRGLVDANRKHTAEYYKDESFFVLACVPGKCTNAAYTYCPSQVQPAVFAPLGDTAPGGAPWSCHDVLAATNLFPDEPLVFPTSGCPRR